MNLSQKLLFVAFFVAAAISGAYGDTIVTGTVFCDQCKDGNISLSDYPLYGIRVKMICPGSNGKSITWGEETTNMLGSYTMTLHGNPDLHTCYAQVLADRQGLVGCGAIPGPAKYPRSVFNNFGTAMYTVDPLLSQPAKAMSFCQISDNPVPVSPVIPPPFQLTPLPPAPFVEASACPHQKWMMPQYRCYWKVVTPDTKAAVAFGSNAALKYGTNMTLWQGLMGRGDPYRTLLREGTTALLNSYASYQFPYNSLAVIQDLNTALVGSTRQVLRIAMGFMKANSGSGSNVSCRFTSCK